MTDRQEKYIAFFDIDKTVLSVNSSVPLILKAYKMGLMPTASLLKAIGLSVVYKLRLRNTIDITESMAFWLKGIPEDTVAKLSEQLVSEKLVHRIRPSVLQEIEYHRSQGARVVILSASLPYTSIPLARHLHMDDVICSSMEVVDGKFTGKPKGKICIEKEKEVRVRQYCSKGCAVEQAWCYGDSYSDRYVMEICGHVVCVTPDSRLKKLAKIRNWKVIR
ncbi:MAG: HAD family phosphatase [Bacteroidales bacterium]|nr:HAD family phosphatase [Bacteroidales bacterium]